MFNIEQFTSNFIESQFPSFYNEEGQLFVLFTKKYYEWLEKNYVSMELLDETNFFVGDVVTQTGAEGVIEAKTDNRILVKVNFGGFRCNNECLNDVTLISSSSGGSTFITDITSTNVNYHSRNLFRYKDLDLTTNRFLVYFKEKYLKNIQFDSVSSKKLLVKAANELYSSKGTERSIDLLFKLVFGVPSTVYYPGNDVFTLSSGKWIIPNYIELDIKDKSKTYLNKTIYGSESNASAFCEHIVTRNIKGKIIDVMYVTNIKGQFVTGESIVDSSGIILDTPKIIGSLSDIQITLGGELFSVGEEVDITSVSGVGAKAFVKEIISETGLVRFTLVDGGWGFSNTASILISQKVYGVDNISNANTSITNFIQFETIRQNLKTFVVNNAINTFLNGSLIYNGDNNYGISVSTTQTTGSNTATLIINELSGNLQSNSVLRQVNCALITFKSNTSSSSDFLINEQILQSNGTSNVSSGVINTISNTVLITVNTSSVSANGIHPGTYVRQTTTLATGKVVALPFDIYNDFSAPPKVVIGEYSGQFSNTDEILIYSNSSFTTRISDFDPLESANTKTIKIINFNGPRWYAGNTAYGDISGEQVSILLSSDSGGITQSVVDVTATANVIGYNTSHIGVISISNTFYSTTNNIIVGTDSNTTGSISFISTGQGANAFINQLLDTEDVRVNTDFLGSNNDGLSSLSVKYSDLLLTGANSTYGYVSEIYINDGGTGYSNDNILVFAGGNTGVGSFGAANGTILTDNSGSILSITLSANTGSGYSSYPSLSIANSTGGTSGIGTNANVVALFPLGFPKLTTGTLNTNLVDILTFVNKNIGTIASLRNINPGENYNVTPFVLPFERGIAEFGKRDYVLTISNASKGFVVNEQIQQIINAEGKQLSCNLVSGNSFIQTKGFLYSTDGINSIASGEKYSFVSNVSSNQYTIVVSNTSGTFQNTVVGALLRIDNISNFLPNNSVTQDSTTGIIVSTNSTHIAVKDVSGTFNANATSLTSNGGGSALITSSNNNYLIYKLISADSNSVFFIANVEEENTSAIAKGRVTFANSSTILVKRTTFFDEFTPTSNNDLIGQQSQANAKIDEVSYNVNTLPIGVNANLIANVITTNGAIRSLTLTDSGFGFIDDEGVDIVSVSGQRVASGKALLITSGIGTGYYSSTKGFVSDQNKIHDGEYYQEYSYEVQSPIPLAKYEKMLKEVLHVAGTRMFSRVITKTNTNTAITLKNSTITITSS